MVNPPSHIFLLAHSPPTTSAIQKLVLTLKLWAIIMQELRITQWLSLSVRRWASRELLSVYHLPTLVVSKISEEGVPQFFLYFSFSWDNSLKIDSCYIDYRASLDGRGCRKARKLFIIALPSFLASIISVGELVEAIFSKTKIADTDKVAQAVELWRQVSGGACLPENTWDIERLDGPTCGC